MGFRWVDQCSSWDDQAGRLQAIRKRSWLKKRAISRLEALD